MRFFAVSAAILATVAATSPYESSSTSDCTTSTEKPTPYTTPAPWSYSTSTWSSSSSSDCTTSTVESTSDCTTSTKKEETTSDCTTETTEATWTTKVVSAMTTVCPTPTQITQNGKTYTVTSATTLTITNCPCTISEKPTPIVSPIMKTSEAPVPYPTAVTMTTSGAAKPTVQPLASASPTVAPITNGAAHLGASGFGLATVAGLVAFFL